MLSRLRSLMRGGVRAGLAWTRSAHGRLLCLALGGLGITGALYVLLGDRLIAAAYHEQAPAWVNRMVGNRSVPLEAYLVAGRLGFSQLLFCVAAVSAIGAGWLLRERVAARVRAFFEAEGDAVNLAVFRILIFWNIFRTVQFETLAFWSGLPTALQMPPWGMGWLVGLVPITPAGVQAAGGALKLFAAMAAVGLWTRVSARLAALLAVYVLAVPQLYGKVNHFHHMVWFAAILAMSRCGDALSLDACRRAWRGAGAGLTDPPPPGRAYALPLRLVWLLFGVLYFFPGFWKWWNGGIAWVWSDNLKFWMYSKWWEGDGWQPIWRIDRYPLAYRLGALGAVVFELGFLWALFVPRLRTAWAVGGLAFHQANTLFLRIGFQSLKMCYAAFVNWAWLARAVGRRLFPDRLFVVYDGHCRLCRRTIACLRVFDLLDRIVYVSAHDEQALVHQHLSALDRQAIMRDMHAVQGDRRWLGYDAYRAIAWRLPLLWPLLPCLYLPPVAAVGRAIYRRVADSRTCELAHHAQLVSLARSVQRAPAPSRALSLAGGALLIGNIYCGSQQRIHAWPLACYPTFSQLKGPTASTIELEVVDHAGRTWPLDGRWVPQQLSSVRWRGLMYQVLATADDAQQRTRLAGIWSLWLREEPALCSVQSVRFYRTVYSTVPERAAEPPLRRQLLWEASPRELAG